MLNIGIFFDFGFQLSLDEFKKIVTRCRMLKESWLGICSLGSDFILGEYTCLLLSLHKYENIIFFLFVLDF